MLISSHIDFDTGDLEKNKIVSGLQQKSQKLWIRLSVNRGEWIFNPKLGVPWHELFENYATADQFKVAIQNEMLKDEEVKQIEYLDVVEVNNKHRTLNIAFKVIFKDGEIYESKGEVGPLWRINSV